MKKLLFAILASVVCSTSWATDIGYNGGTLPNQGQAIGGVGADGLFHFLGLTNTGSINVTNAPSGAVLVSKSTALEIGRVVKASPGTLIYLGVHNTGAAALSVLMINATTVPVGAGAVSLLYPAIKVPAGGDMTFNPPIPITAATGIVVMGSTTDTFTGTPGTAVLEIYALYQ